MREGVVPRPAAIMNVGRGHIPAALRLILVIFVSFCVCVTGASDASALPASFGTEGEAAGQLSSQPLGIAVDQTSGDVYVADRGDHRISKFGSEGEFLLAWGWGVADGEERPQTCTVVCLAGSTGGGAGQFNYPQGVAVDNDPLNPSHGDVYVADPRNQRVDKFEADGAFVWAAGDQVNRTEVQKREEQEAGSKPVTVTPEEENLCTAASGDECGEGVAGTGPGEFELSEAGGVVAVSAAGTVYVGDNNRVQELSEAGVFEAEIKLPGAGPSKDVAVTTGEDVYVESEGLGGVREYSISPGCRGTCTGKEVGKPRDLAGEPSAIALGEAGELFVNDGEGIAHHVLEYGPTGDELRSFDSGTEAPTGLAYSDKLKLLYALNPGVVRLVPVPPPGPLVVRESAAEVEPTTATLEATVNAEGHEEESSHGEKVPSSKEELRYHFEYGETQTYGKSTPSQAVIGGSFEDRHPSAPLTGLAPHTTYHFRVVVTNAAHETSDGPDETFTTLPPALIESESVSQVSATSAKLQAELNPIGLSTTYRFEYDTSEYVGDTRHGASVPIGEGDAGAGTSAAPFSILVEGLTPGMTYHYRVVAKNALGEAPGPDHTFTTQGAVASSSLIDGRAWEMVSPPDKHGATLVMSDSEGGVIQAAEDGGAITYLSAAPVQAHPAGTRSFAYSQLLSTRGPDGWTTADLTAPGESVQGLTGGSYTSLNEYKAFSADLSNGLLEPESAIPLSPQASERTPYIRQTSGEEYIPLLNPADVAPGIKFGGKPSKLGGPFTEASNFITATPDFSHVLVSSPVSLTAGFESEANQSLYEWSGGRLQLVSILPDEVPAAAKGLTSRVGAQDYGVRNAMSPDGSRVVFETYGEFATHLYLRDVPDGKTIQLDVPEASVKRPGEGAPLYVDASNNDEKVFFLDEMRLTANSDAQSSEPDLYMCEIQETAGGPTCALKDLSVSLHAGEDADVLGTDIGTDETGRYIYFVANGVLAPGATRGDCSFVGASSSNSCNLYMHDTVTGETRLVAVLSNLDQPDWSAGGFGTDYGELTARVSANGSYLAFMSQRSLTGYDNRDALSGLPDEEVYLYDAETRTLRCVSCNPTGERPRGVLSPQTAEPPYPQPLLADAAQVWSGQWLAGSIPGWTKVDDFHALQAPRDLFDNGRLFFNSPDALVPQDANGKEDVYEYEPGGIGNCDLGAGCIGLISSGTSNEESAFLDAGGKGPGGEGEDVFFMTAAKLVPQDVDTALDIYDAHVCSTAAPCPNAAVSVAPACTTTDSCRAAPAPQPDFFGVPPSATFHGTGNLAPMTPAGKKTAAQLRAGKLTKALQSCRRDRLKGKRAKCEAFARKKYEPVKHRAKTHRRGAGS